MQKDKAAKRTINGWAMYDWANSVYSLVITSTIFPIYYNAVTTTEAYGDKVQLLGFELSNTVLYSYAISASFLIIAFLSPLLSGIADYGAKKLFFLKFFAYLGSIACALLFFFDGSSIAFGIICSMLASIGYAGSIVFYNAYLPEITTAENYDMVSAKGFALGYIGSVILLVINLLMISMPEFFGLADAGQASRISFLMVGIWWAGFAQITFRTLPKQVSREKADDNLLKKGYQEIRKVWKSLKDLSGLKKFLATFFFYSMGVQTIMYLAASFGDKELQLSGDQLILTVLIIQLVAIGGAYLFAYISKLKGNKFSLLSMILIWVAICILAYRVYSSMEFYGLAFMVGMVMGGIQSLSRATYSKLIPQNTIDNTSYFSFFDVTEKIAIVIGTFSYGLIEQLTGSMRNSTIALASFFVIGFLILFFNKMPKLVREPQEN
jgi:UMF1 family MFS transporter